MTAGQEDGERVVSKDPVPVSRRLLPLPRVTLLATYALVALVQLLQSSGLTTFDTKLDLLVDPGRFLSQSLTLWSPQLGMGEVQNQAYGYLFPIGPFFWLGHALAVPGWVTERLWSTIVTIVAFEGARRLALAWGGLGWRGAMLAGAAYVAAPRFLTTIGALTGEVLPTAVLPWVVLPLVLARRGCLGWLAGVLLSGVAILFAGGQNAVETFAVLPLPAVVLVHAVVRAELPRRSLAVWVAAVAAGSAWWVGPLLLLGRYSPPFLDYIESAANTTSVLGWVNSVRGADHWVAYVTVGGRPWWPAGYSLATSGWLVVITAVVAGLSLAGLMGRRVPDRVCLTIPVAVGLVCLVAAHGGWSGGLFAVQLRSLLDGPLAPLRNVHKVDPLVRLPLALGFGYLAHDARAAVGSLVERVPRWAARSGASASVLVAAVAVAVLGASTQPAAAGELRQLPGWSAVPQPWIDAAAAVDALPAGSRVLVLPASGFGQQVWGNTVDEPLQALTTGSWTARGQAPLVPGDTVRLLDSVERLVSSGRGSLGLAPLLARSGFTDVLLRTDLDPGASDAPDPGVVEDALRSSLGLTLADSFGVPPGASLPLQLWGVDPGGSGDPRVTVTSRPPVTVQGGPESLLMLLRNGLVTPDEPVLLAGQNSPDSAPVDILTDSLQRREQEFGRVNDASSSVMTASEPFRLVRAAHDYPAFPGEQQTVARYPGLASASASSSGGYVDILGAIHPEEGPYSALDSDGSTAWVSAPFTNPLMQSLTVSLPDPVSLGPVSVQLWSGPGDPQVSSLLVTTDTGSVTVPVDETTDTATVTLPPGPTRTLCFAVSGVESLTGSRQVGFADINLPGVDASRTLVVPGTVGPDTTMLFSSAPPVRACSYPQRACSINRSRPAEEAAALDRSFTVVGAGRWHLAVEAVARPSIATDGLLAPVAPGYAITGSSVLDGDPVAAPVFALDDNPLTSWITDPGDQSPTLTLSWPKARTLSRIQIGLGTQDGVRRPTVVRLQAGSQHRVVSLSPSSFGFFRPLHTNHVTLTFGAGSRLHRGGVGLPMEISEVVVKGLHGIRYSPSPSSVTGQPCGFGPPVFVDGVRHDTSVAGTLGDVLDGSPLRVSLCGSTAVALSSGPHRIRVASTAEFQATQALLTPVDGTLAAQAVAPIRQRPLDITSWGSTDRTMTVGAGGPSLLWVRENVSTGWIATFGGHTLAPVTIDGWAQGWRLPGGGAGVVTLSFDPQSTYSATLLGGGVLALLLIASVVLVLVRRRPVDPMVGHPGASHGGRVTRIVALVATALAALLAGFGLLIGAGLGMLPFGRTLWPRRGVVLLLVTAAAWWQMVVGGDSQPADLLAALAVGLVLGPDFSRQSRDDAEGSAR